MSKEEIKHFKAILKQGILRHKNVLLDYKFQEELLNIIKNYEKALQRINKTIEYIENAQTLDYGTTKEFNIKEFPFVQHILEILEGAKW